MANWIIVVDDDTANRQMAGQILSAGGYYVTALRSGQSLLDYLREQTPDLILLSVNSPGIDGFALMKQLDTAGGDIADIKKHRVNLTAWIISLVLILVMLPLTFFTGGGIYGGSPVWFVFCTLFVSLIVYGNKKYILLILEAIVAGICFVLAYRVPWLVTQYPLETASTGGTGADRR